MTTERSTALRQILSANEEIRTANQQSMMLWGAVLVNLLIITIIAFIRNEGLLIGFGIIGSLIALAGLGFRLYIHYKQKQSDPRQLVNRLQTQLERASAVYHLSSTLSSTLDYETTLDNAQEAGHLALYPKYKALNLISAALLFRHSDGKLHVATARNLNPQDYQVAVSAKNGILAKALEAHEPVIGGCQSLGSSRACHRWRWFQGPGITTLCRLSKCKIVAGNPITPGIRELWCPGIWRGAGQRL
jgi:hypothetical protein